MTQTLTNEQVATAKAAATEAMESKKFAAEWHSYFVLDLIATLEDAKAENAKLREALERIDRANDSMRRFNGRINNIVNQAIGLMDERTGIRAALIKETPLIAAAKEGE